MKSPLTRSPRNAGRSLLIAAVAAGLQPGLASVDFTEHYLDLSPASRFTLRFDVNSDNRIDAEVTGALQGRVDADLKLSDTGPAAVLEAFRLRRITLKPDADLSVVGTGAAAGFRARLVNASMHLGDGLGRTGTDASVTSSLTAGVFSWSQLNDNWLAARGSLRTRGAGGQLDELLDLSQAEATPVRLFGTWELLDLGTRSRLFLRYSGREKVRSIVPITVDMELIIDASRPLAAPPPPTTIAGWSAAAGLAGAAAAPGADPDGDGRVNLVEYGEATDPTRADATPAPLLAEARDGQPVFVFVRHENRTDLEYRLETSADMRIWKPVAAAGPGADAGGIGGGVVVEETLNAPGVWRLVVRDPACFAGGPERFARLVFQSSP